MKRTPKEAAATIAKALAVHAFDNEESAEDAIMSQLQEIEKVILSVVGVSENEALVTEARQHVTRLNETIGKLAAAGVSVELEDKKHTSPRGLHSFYILKASAPL